MGTMTYVFEDGEPSKKELDAKIAEAKTYVKKLSKTKGKKYVLYRRRSWTDPETGFHHFRIFFRMAKSSKDKNTF